eukprot:INCI2350.1.p1 GENE.INCI2350.1~~INCI2350.1.p1  ORF type:complete len:173 (+),score=30.33 INCI2350.1:185-703(+)
MAKQVVKLTSLQYVSRIVCRYGPFDTTSVGTREFARRTNSSKLKKTNRKCEVSSEVVHDGSDARVEFSFDDGSTHTLPSSNLSLNQIIQRMNQKRGQIMLLEQYKLNPGQAEEMKKIDEHFKQVEEVLGFNNVLFEIPTSQGMAGIPIEPATEEEIERLNLQQLLQESYQES